MINTTLLDNYIKDSGLDISVIAKNLNLSEREFVHKKDNVKDFSVMEILTLCDLLGVIDVIESGTVTVFLR